MRQQIVTDDPAGVNGADADAATEDRAIRTYFRASGLTMEEAIAALGAAARRKARPGADEDPNELPKDEQALLEAYRAASDETGLPLREAVGLLVAAAKGKPKPIYDGQTLLIHHPSRTDGERRGAVRTFHLVSGGELDTIHTGAGLTVGPIVEFIREEIKRSDGSHSAYELAVFHGSRLSAVVSVPAGGYDIGPVTKFLHGRPVPEGTPKPTLQPAYVQDFDAADDHYLARLRRLVLGAALGGYLAARDAETSFDAIYNASEGTDEEEDRKYALQHPVLHMREESRAHLVRVLLLLAGRVENYADPDAPGFRYQPVGARIGGRIVTASPSYSDDLKPMHEPQNADVSVVEAGGVVELA